MSQNDQEYRQEDRIYYIMGHECSYDKYFQNKIRKNRYIEKFKDMGFAPENIFVKCISDFSTASNITHLYLNKSHKSKLTTRSMNRKSKRFAPYKNTNLPEQLQIAYPKLNRMVKTILEDVKNVQYRNIFIVGHSAGGAFVNRIAKRLNAAAINTPEIRSKIQMATLGSIWFWKCPKAEQRVQIYNYVSTTDISQLCSGSVCHKGELSHNCVFQSEYQSKPNPLCDCYDPNIENDENVVIICLYKYKYDSNGNLTYKRICDNKHRLLEHNSYDNLIFYLLTNRCINIYDEKYESNRIPFGDDVKNTIVSKKHKPPAVSKSPSQQSSHSNSKTAIKE